MQLPGICQTITTTLAFDGFLKCTLHLQPENASEIFILSAGPIDVSLGFNTFVFCPN